jgi:hypothetical protein
MDRARNNAFYISKILPHSSRASSQLTAHERAWLKFRAQFADYFKRSQTRSVVVEMSGDH